MVPAQQLVTETHRNGAIGARQQAFVEIMKLAALDVQIGNSACVQDVSKVFSGSCVCAVGEDTMEALQVALWVVCEVSWKFHGWTMGLLEPSCGRGRPGRPALDQGAHVAGLSLLLCLA